MVLFFFFKGKRKTEKRKKIIEVPVCVHVLCIKKGRRKGSLRWKVFILPWVAQSSCCSQGHQTDTLLFDIQHLVEAVEAQTLKDKIKKAVIFQCITVHYVWFKYCHFYF